MERLNSLRAVVSETEHLPARESMEVGVAYLPRDRSVMAFFCPCGCGREVFIPFEDHCTVWKLESVEPLTVSPSIQMTSECRAHYFIRGGRIIWC
ncbi:hypothetical protein GC173_08135 [bacterium]|nr:hypothetical protein [bacterium]